MAKRFNLYDIESSGVTKNQQATGINPPLRGGLQSDIEDYLGKKASLE
jgi:hypothetical protein